MQYSVVNKSLLNDEFRIDSEYYSPDNLIMADIVKKSKYELLRDICTIIAGPFGSTVTTEWYNPESGCRYIRGKDIQSFFVEKNDRVFIDKHLFDELSQFHLKPDDILLTVVGAKFGKAAIVNSDDCPAIFSCKSTLLRDPKVNVSYLATYLSSDIGYGLIRRGHRGAAQPGINLFDIRNVPVPILSKEFQSEIESLVCRSKSYADESTKVYRKAQNLLLDDLGLSNWKPKHRPSFVKNYSDTDGAARIDAEYFQPKYDEIVKAIKGYSGGWDMLGNITSIKKCVEVGSEAYIDEGDIPFVRVSNLSPFEITEEKYISDELYAELSQHQPQQGEILFSKDGTPGIAYHFNEKPKKMIPSGGILRLKIRTKQINEDCLTLVLNSLIVQEQIDRDVGGSIILHWRPDQVKQTLIPVLDDEKQKKIQGEITESFNLRKQSKHLLQCAKRAVEIAIEQNEDVAIKWLQVQTKEARLGEQDDKRQPKRLYRGRARKYDFKIS
jgi:type I restriction enzyme S subunit